MEKSRPDRKQVFRFKQFEVDQRDCAMKISTDGVLLGALAGPVPVFGATSDRDVDRPRILDIGTGTGVVALMLAQRFPSARVDAVEIDATAAARAGSNFEQSPFSGRMQVHHAAFEDFLPDASRDPYDLIVSNPPFFIDSLRNPDQRKGQARHADWSFFETLLARAYHWLSDGGSLQLILPPGLSERVKERAVGDHGFMPGVETGIFSFATDPAPVRILLSLYKLSEDKRSVRFLPGSVQHTTENHIESPARFLIYREKGVHAPEYRQTLAGFFLDF